LRTEEVERLLAVAKVLDTRWGKLSALIIVAFHSSLRVGNLTALRRRDIDLEQRTADRLQTAAWREMEADDPLADHVTRQRAQRFLNDPDAFGEEPPEPSVSAILRRSRQR
jgi:integrase